MELLEREGFLQTLQQRFQNILSGEGCSIFIQGEAGIGKSSLVRHFLKEITEEAETFVALCDSLFTPRPLGVLYDLSTQIDPELAERMNATSSRTQVFTDFLRTVTDRNKPIVLVIEDIHWADEASLDFIKYFARRIENTRCLLILTYRDNEITLQHPLRNVLGELPPNSYTRLALLPLSKEAVDQMVKERGYEGENVYALTNGNPFYVTELLADYRTEIPDSIRNAVLILYNRCSQATIEAWQLISVMPEGIEISLLQRFDPNWHQNLELCIYHKLFLFRKDRLVFKHEIFRKTVESFLSPLKRIEINKKITELFLDDFLEQNMLERIVHYAKNGAQNALVVTYAPKAAEEAATLGAHVEAAKLYLAAIEYSNNRDTDQLVKFYEAYTYECYLTNQIKEAILYQTKALRIWQSKNDLQQIGNSQRFLSRLWWFDGHRKEADTYALQSIQTFEPLPASKAKAMAFSNLSQLRMLNEDVEECLEWGNKAIAMSEAIGDQETRVHALNNVGTVKLKTPSLIEEGRKQLSESLEIAAANCLHEHAARAYTNFLSCSVSTRDYDIAEHYLEEGMQYCSQRDLHSWSWYMISWKARMLLEKGDWESAGALAGNLLMNPLQPGIIKVTASLIKGIIKVRRNEEGGLALLEEARQLAFTIDEHLRIVPVVNALLEYEWLTGEQVLTNEEIGKTIGFVQRVANTWMNSEAAFWLKKARNIDIGLTELYEPYQLLCDDKPAEAAAFWERKGCPYERAFALFAGDEEQKRDALVLLENLGADAVYQKLKSEMRSSGIKKIPRGLRTSTKSNPAQLTNRELDILQLLQTGSSNKEIGSKLFISPKTVDHHISSILFKLDVNSRNKAVGEAIRLGVLK